jgi:hypothetical protein
MTARWTQVATSIVAAIGMLAAGGAAAADPALERAAAAMRVDDLKTVRYTGDGVGWTFGQAFEPGGAWPKVRLNPWTRTIDYRTGAMRDEHVLTRAEATGGGGYPHTAPQRNDQFLHGTHTWNQAAAGSGARAHASSWSGTTRCGPRPTA